VDRSVSTAEMVADTLATASLEIIAATSVEDALQGISSSDVDLVLADMDLILEADGTTLDLFKSADDPPELALMTAAPTVDGASNAVKMGASHFLSKPLDLEALKTIAQRAVDTRRIAQENSVLRRLISRQDVSDRLISKSAAMKEVLATVERVAGAKASVLLTGETGSGKSLIAQIIHQLSPRAAGPFMPINCGALQEQLLESELFGHTKGAFTGAVTAKLGLFEVAHDGTLFLDEIAEMSPAMQTRLLQVLDSGQLRRVGGTKLRPFDARIIAATNKDLKASVREGTFREDLFYRLNVVRIRVPPLRSRIEDIPDLVETLFVKHGAHGTEPKTMSRRALRILMQYHWPGNVRELANLIENVNLLAAGDVILPEDLPRALQPAGSFESMAIEVPLPFTEMERLHIMRALDFTGGKKAPAARLLGIDVKTLTNKIKTYKIEY